jgi:hypothetical protein
VNSEALLAHLIGIARRGELTTYRRLAAAFALDLSTPVDRERLAGALRDVSVAEHRAGRPLLSALVVLAGRRRPGAGFFDCARAVGALTDVTDEDFYEAELTRVYRQWSPASPS